MACDAGEAEILDGLGLIAAARIVVRQIREVIVQGRGIEELDGAPHILMQLLAALLEDRVVGDLLRERVLEDILDVGDRRLLVDELAKLEVGEETLELLVRVSGDGPGETEDELPAEDGKSLQERLLVVAQPVDTRGEDGLHGRRNAQRRKRLDQLDRPLRSLQGAFVEQRLNRLLHEERGASGGLDDELLERQQAVGLSKHGRQHLIGIVMAESVKPQRLRVGLVTPTKLILRPEVDQQQQPRIGHLLDQQIEERLALVVQPMQILDDQHQGLSRGLGQQNANHSVERARPPELRIHGGQTQLVVLDLKERVEIGERGLER